MATYYGGPVLKGVVKKEGSFTVTTIYTVPASRYAVVVINSYILNTGTLDVTKTDGITFAYSIDVTASITPATGYLEIVLYAGQSIKTVGGGVTFFDMTVREYALP